MNLLTNSMERLTNMLVNCDTKLKAYGVEPYGQRELTDREQRDRIKNMSENDLLALIEQHGVQEVNAWLNKYWRENG